MTNAPGELAVYRDDLDRALKLLDEKAPGYKRGREYYDGTRSEVSASPTVRRLIEANAEAAPISLAHIPVDVLADKVELASLSAKEAPAAAALEAIADANDLDDEADDWVRKACYFGDYYVITDPQLEDGAGAVIAEGIDWVPASPLTSIVIYDRKTGRVAEYGMRRWEGKGKRWHARLYYNDGTVKLVTPEGMTQGCRPNDFLLDDGGEDGGEFIGHDGGRILLSHLAIDGKPYGKPVHTKAYGPQDAITKISATNLNNVDGQGFASRWALADPLAEIDDDIDNDFGDDGPEGAAPGTAPDGMTKATTGTSRVRTIPGAIALLRGIKEVGQFDVTDSDNFLKNLDWYVRVMAVASGIALFEFDLKGEQPSGESRRRAEGRSNKHARKIQRAAGSFFRELGDTALSLLGIKATVAATFNPLETSTDKDGLELVSAKIKAGVPITQALLEAGYTDEQVSAWYPPNVPHVTPELLTVLATALAALGNAKTLGVITDAELADMLPTILTGARGEGPVVEPPAPDTSIVTDPNTQLKAKADALKALVDAGATFESAATTVGLDGLEEDTPAPVPPALAPFAGTVPPVPEPVVPEVVPPVKPAKPAKPKA